MLNLFSKNRLVHSINKMIACNYNGVITLITKEDFGNLARKIMPELDLMEITDFLLGVSTGVTASRKSIKKMKAWEKTFLSRLNNEFENEKFLPIYTFNVKDAGTYLYDFLEAYRYSYKLINYEYLNLENTDQELVKIELLKRSPNILDAALKRDIESYKTITFKKSDIVLMKGTSRVFWLTIKNKVLEFTPKGVKYVKV
ncbi:MAG: hypothetical protein KJ804_09170 [Proteobacteria bacterium]|nr:hypothetical protein [Pseudomonadota bacterium]MBU1058470.1 hypothetical protein [Pseudomonadota bacterium]